ncbi:MAG TPA: HAD family phosphatase [Bacteroidales bacterium]|nr:HAD family phosphatase [Bacteroidales bacterium]HOS57757.1 HAD family phosphatase [Bacteroidales bacterium]HRR03802.1 HAD family phosphatase [Bacteroidales bacterium]HRT13299.1 HAD family phosphatase [Bacteroidales bacterium]HXK74750.1 HAD family phosphatase [Bacteroidales bacterium]
MIKNIIFDLGGVIYDIDYYRIVETFAQFGLADFDKKYTQEKQTEMIDKFEEGKIPVVEFRNYIRSLSSVELTDNQIDTAWNAILIDIPAHRVKLLEEVKKNYSIFLFSNTNELNYNQFVPAMKKKFGFDIFTTLFEKSFFSHHIGLRKPNKESFEYIIKNQNLDPTETLFIDDTIRHVEGAKQVGLVAYHLENMDISSLFDKGLLRLP